ncbi:hypothetical protein [Nocardia tengchongensis]|uniref:hypothetical protein n=1 Tax=Nocardia tengchongensis TaxID=2055889 RepID=UPI003662173B
MTDTSARADARAAAEDIAARIPDAEVVEGEYSIEVWVNWLVMGRGPRVPAARITVPDQLELLARAPRFAGATFELGVPGCPAEQVGDQVMAAVRGLFPPGAVQAPDRTFNMQVFPDRWPSVRLMVPVAVAADVAEALAPLIHPGTRGE